MSSINLKFFIIFCLYNIKIILGILFLLLSYIWAPYVPLKIREYTHFKFLDIRDKAKSIFIILVPFLGLLAFFFLRRLLNIGYSFDAMDHFMELRKYFEKTSYYEIFSSILLVISIILLYIILLRIIKKIFFTHLFKIHLYLLSKEKIQDCNNPHESQNGVYLFTELSIKKTCTSYFHFSEKFDEVFDRIESIPYNLLKPFLPILIGEDLPYGSKYALVKFKITEKLPYLFLYLSLLSLIYDFIFNFLYITKIFYILPFAFIHYLFYMLRWLLNGNSQLNYMSLQACLELSFLYYIPHKKEINKNIDSANEGDKIIYFFKNGFICTQQHINQIFELIRKMHL